MRAGILGMFLMMLIAPAALAQTGKHFALGVGLGVSKYIDKDFSSKNPEVSLAYRINLKPGANNGWTWAPKGSLRWSDRKTSTDIGGIRTQLGKLRTALVMVGVQRGLRQGPFQIGFSVVGGASFNHFVVDGAARDAYLSRLGRTLSDIKVKNSFAVGPEVSATYDLGRWFALQGSLAYLFDRPKAEITSGGVTSSSTWKTDHANASIGLLVGIF